MLTTYRDYFKKAADAAAEEDPSIDPETIAKQQYEDFLKSISLDEEKTIQMYKDEAVRKKVYEYYIKDCNATESECKEYYETLLGEQEAMDKTNAEGAYYSYVNQEYSQIVYVPSLAKDRIKICEQILIPFEEATVSKIIEINSNADYDDTEKKEKIEKIRDSALDSIRPKAEEVLTKVQAGEEFEKLMKEYSSDYYENMDNTYRVYEGVDLDKDFVSGALGLQNIGDTSDLVASNYGYHIIKFIDNPSPGPIPYEDLKDQIESIVSENKKSDLWLTTVNKWIDEDSEILVSFSDGYKIEQNHETDTVSPLTVAAICIAAAIVVIIVIMIIMKKRLPKTDGDQ